MFEDNGAKFSDDRSRRYALWRIWDKSLPVVAFIGLNPSLANHTDNDPTIRRVIGFAKDWGYGGVYMLNLYTFVTPYPESLVESDAWEESRQVIISCSSRCEKIIAAWGNYKGATDRGNEIKKLIPNLYALQINKNGSPKHPLYVKSDVIPIIYNQQK